MQIDGYIYKNENVLLLKYLWCLNMKESCHELRFVESQRPTAVELRHLHLQTSKLYSVILTFSHFTFSSSQKIQ